MSSITIPVKVNDHPHMRPLNVLRDLPAVADLIELCFSSTMDNDGQRYLSDMRRASHDDSFLSWASHMAETASMPLMGYVWEQDGRIIGNASLIPFRDHGRRVYLIANVATHPDYRRRGIGRALTECCMQQARNKGGYTIWLHVRDDNPGAIQLYAGLGFEEIARRTTWQAVPDRYIPVPRTSIQIIARQPRFWPLQQDWLHRTYPDVLSWYHSWNFNALRPGLLSWLYLLFVDFNIHQWAAVRNDQLLATLTWMPQTGKSETLYAATKPASLKEGWDAASGELDSLPNLQGEALTQLLIHARRTLSNYSTLSLDFPASDLDDAIRDAGFRPRRTLLWMRTQ